MSVVAILGLLNVFCGGGGGGGDSGGTSSTGGTTNTATFTGTQGGANPASQGLTARNTTTSEQAWSATASSKDAGRAVPAWLTIATSSGTIAAGGTITLTVSVNLAGLAPGTYTATITLSPANVFDPPSFTITLTVSASTGGGTEPTPDTTIDAAEKDAPDEGLEGANSLVVHIMSVWGGTRSDSTFQAGDFIKVRYILKTYGTNGTDGTNLTLANVAYGEIVVSGPTSHYQPVFRKLTDVLTVSQPHSSNDGSYVYTFANPIPATYAAPEGDGSSFGASDGEWQGQPLVAGTYTVGMMFYREVSITEASGTAATYRVGDTHVRDFLFGGASTFESREVVTRNNCNRCHGVIRMHKKLSHGRGTRRDTRYCVLCHVDGSEDGNDPAVAGGTPGVSISLRNMIHKVHNGAHLPSVLGVGYNADGTRNYAATPTPYQLADGASLDDFSDINFPVMPSAYVAYLYDQAGTTYTGTGGNGPMPRDVGYTALPAASKLLDDQIRTGVVACGKCHGDPDGSGPLAAPTQGGQYATMPSRMACGSCHADVNFATGTGHQGGVQTTDADCGICHKPSGLSDVAVAHTHPYNSSLNTGVNVTVAAVGGGAGPGGNHQAGNPVTATFSVKDNAGADINIHTLTRFQMIITGPTSNPQWIVPNINVFDFSFRKSSPFTGNGSIGSLSVASGAVAQVLAIVFTGVNTFDVVGSVSGNLATGVVVPDGGGNTGNLTYAGVTFKVTDGSTNFVANDRWYFEVVPPAASYTVNVPFDITYERVGAATGGADVFTIANTPLYWGRQTVFERTALAAGTVLTAAASALGRYVAADKTALDAAAIAVGDKVVLDAGTASEEYVTVGRIQTTDDVTGADFVTQDRVWFTAALRYAHNNGAAIQEPTLTSKREGTAYTVTNGATGQITLVAGQFTAANPVVVSYRTYARFGWYRGPGDALQAVYPAPTFDSDDFDVTYGEWKGLPFIDGTYTVGMWANKDFTVKPDRTLTTTEAWNATGTDNTTYRMMALPATKPFLFGNAATITLRTIISSGDNCNRCHDDLAFHGFGRRGLDTCLLCHTAPGTEDAAKYAYNSWYVGATPGTTVDFRDLVHKIHRGKDLVNANLYAANGVFLGVPYPMTVDEIEFTSMPAGVRNCAICHGNTSWQEPATRNHPAQTNPTRHWRAACYSCHNDPAVAQSMNDLSPTSDSGCAVCHKVGSAIPAVDVSRVHINR